MAGTAHVRGAGERSIQASVRCYVSVNSWATICYVSSVSSVLTEETCYLLPRVRAQAGESERVVPVRRGLQSCEEHHEDMRVITVSDDQDEKL